MATELTRSEACCWGELAVTQRPIVSSRNPLRTEPMNPIGTITLDTA